MAKTASQIAKKARKRLKQKAKKQALAKRKEAAIEDSINSGMSRERATQYMDWVEKISTDEQTKMLIPGILSAHQLLDFVVYKVPTMISKGLQDGVLNKAQASELAIHNFTNMLEKVDELATQWADIHYKKITSLDLKMKKRIEGGNMLPYYEEIHNRVKEPGMRRLKAEFKWKEGFPLSDFEKKCKEEDDWVTKEELSSFNEHMWGAHLELVEKNPKQRREDTLAYYSTMFDTTLPSPEYTNYDGYSKYRQFVAKYKN